MTSSLEVLDVRDVPGSMALLLWSTSTSATPGIGTLDIAALTLNPITSTPAVLAKIVVKLTGSANTTSDFVLDSFLATLASTGAQVAQESPASNTYQRGDALQDGTTNIVDALAVLRCHFKKTPVGTKPGEECHPINSAGPVHDGPVGDRANIVDALAILQRHFKKIDQFFR